MLRFDPSPDAPATTTSEVRAAIEDLQAEIRAAKFGPKQSQVSLSYGLAEFPADTSVGADLLALAFKRMRQKRV